MAKVIFFVNEIFLFLNFFNVYFIFERDRQSMSRGGAERERERSRERERGRQRERMNE